AWLTPRLVSSAPDRRPPLLPPMMSLPWYVPPPWLPSFPTRRSSDLNDRCPRRGAGSHGGRSRCSSARLLRYRSDCKPGSGGCGRSEEHTSELQSRRDLVCRPLLEKKNSYGSQNLCLPARKRTRASKW